jgi:hypothetical protein
MMENFEKAPTRKDFAKPYPNVGFYLPQHHIALESWAEKAELKIKELEHYRDSTIGLFATDRLDLVNDEKNVMFLL